MPETENIRLMGTDPAKAIRVMTIPLIFAFLLSSVQIYIDSFWCAGLGNDANSSINIAGPVYWVILDIGAGLGVGVSTAISRALGAKEHERANSLASQAFVLILLISVVSGALMYLCARPLVSFTSGGLNVELSMEYLTPYLICSFFLMMNGIILGMLRAEGEARKSSALSIVASLINIVMDPILIYIVGWGLSGAAWATCLSYIATTGAGLYLYLAHKQFVKPVFRHFRFIKEQLWDIFRVGIPHALELAVIPLLMIPQNSLVVRIGGTDGMITYSLPYRYISLAIVPVQAIAAAMIPVVSYATGEKDMKKALFGINYSAKLIVKVSLVFTVILLLFATPFSYAFTYEETMVQFRSEIAMVIRIYGLALLAIAMIELCSSILQTLCFAQLATVTMFTRELVFLGLFYIATFFDMTAIYWSLDIAEVVGAAMMALCARYAIRQTVRRYGLGGSEVPAA